MLLQIVQSIVMIYWNSIKYTTFYRESQALPFQGHSIFKLSESRIIAEDAEDADFRV